MRAWFARLFSRRAPGISEASTSDAASFNRLHGASFHRGWSEDEMERLLADPAVLAHRIGTGRHTAGFIMSRRAADEAEILSVVVEPAQRSAGLGRALLHLHLRRLAGLGVTKVFLEVDEANAAARRLYARAGFEIVGQRPGYYSGANSGPSAALVLRRDL